MWIHAAELAVRLWHSISESEPECAAARAGTFPTVTPAARPAVPASAPSAAPAPRDTAEVQALLARYRSAFAALDLANVKAIWPTVNGRVLKNAFAQLRAQEFAFDGCQIEVNGRQASATCRGTARFVPKVGSRDPRVESRRWTFHFQVPRRRYLGPRTCRVAVVIELR
jgi:hypothetical protein